MHNETDNFTAAAWHDWLGARPIVLPITEVTSPEEKMVKHILRKSTIRKRLFFFSRYRIGRQEKKKGRADDMYNCVSGWTNRADR